MALPDDIMNTLIKLSLAAGDEIMDVFASDFSVSEKDDKSPVTEADQRAEDVIIAGLLATTPDIPIVAEEMASAGQAPKNAGAEFWLVDPLDGTREFINRRTDFTVNIALIRDGAPVIGVVYAPALDKLYTGDGPNSAQMQDKQDGTWNPLHPISVRKADTDALIVVASRSHRSPETDTHLEQLNVASVTSAGSSLKFCLLAAGEADYYPRLGRTMEWDTGAGDAVLRAAGGIVEVLGGGPLQYGKPGFENPHFVARSLSVEQP